MELAVLCSEAALVVGERISLLENNSSFLLDQNNAREILALDVRSNIGVDRSCFGIALGKDRNLTENNKSDDCTELEPDHALADLLAGIEMRCGRGSSIRQLC